MRKTMIAAALAACLLGGSVWAEGYVPPEVPGVWQEISKSDMDTLFFDTSRCTYDPAADTAVVWMRTDTENLKETYVTQYTIDFGTGRIRTDRKGWLYKNGRVRELVNASMTMAIQSGTYGEKLAEAVAAYVDRDGQRAARQTGGAEPAEGEA